LVSSVRVLAREAEIAQVVQVGDVLRAVDGLDRDPGGGLGQLGPGPAVSGDALGALAIEFRRLPDFFLFLRLGHAHVS
jgi:hypothetical protein